MSRTAELREDLVIAALEYTAHVFEANGTWPGHFSQKGKALGAAAKAYQEELKRNESAAH